jgi:glutamyl-tRNA synthetase
MTDLYHALAALHDWTAAAIHQVIVDIAAQHVVNMGKIAQPLRIAVTGRSMSPSIDATVALLGKPRTLNRLQHALVVLTALPN